MVPAILILTFAWSLEGHDRLSGCQVFRARLRVSERLRDLQSFLPAIVFIIGCLLAFATGTSWGTFGMLIPIVHERLPHGQPHWPSSCISACMAGAVCGDHCSPISDTTIMASAGAQCDHVNHVSTQLPYAITVAAVQLCELSHRRLRPQGVYLPAHRPGADAAHHLRPAPHPEGEGCGLSPQTRQKEWMPSQLKRKASILLWFVWSPGLHGHRNGLVQGVALVALQLHAVRREVVEVGHRRVQPELGGLEGCSGDDLLHDGHVAVVDVGVGNDVDQLARPPGRRPGRTCGPGRRTAPRSSCWR